MALFDSAAKGNELYHQLPRRLKLRELRILVAVADSGSFHGAARATHVSQPAITNAIASLEEALGVKLFDRTPQGAQPTPQGINFILRSRAIFGELRLAIDEISASPNGAQKVLHVGTVALPASGILPVALKQLRDEHPGIEVSVLEASEQVLEAALKARRIDLFMSRMPRDSQDPAFTFETLYEDSLCVITNNSHSLAVREKLDFSDLKDEAWVLPPAGSFFHDHIQRALSKGGIPLPQAAIETLSAPVMHGLINEGNYVGFSTKSVWSFNPMKSLLAQLDIELPRVKAPIGVVILKDRQIDPLGLSLIDNVKRLAMERKI